MSRCAFSLIDARALITATTSLNVTQSTSKGTVVFKVRASDAEGETVDFDWTCVPAGCPFYVLNCKSRIVKFRYKCVIFALVLIFLSNTLLSTCSFIIMSIIL